MTVRWGIISTANIARGAFLPALRVSGGGVADAVAGRDAARTAQWAAEHGVARAVAGYQALIEDPSVDALYIAVPNSLHADLTIAALRAGKPVLCEKPLCGVLADTERVLSVAQETGTLLWEAFVFPFNEHMERIKSLIADGAIGELREVQSNFHFPVSRPENIRFSAELQGGALRDVGCYPVRLAQELFGEHSSAWAASVVGGGLGAGGELGAGGGLGAGGRLGAGGELGAGGGPRAGGRLGVDVELWGSLGYQGDRRLLLSCGMRRSRDTFSRLLGTSGQIQVANLFHPGAADKVTLIPSSGEVTDFPATADEPPFTPALRHINAVLEGEAEPRLLAVETSLITARALHDLAAAT